MDEVLISYNTEVCAMKYNNKTYIFDYSDGVNTISDLISELLEDIGVIVKVKDLNK